MREGRAGISYDGGAGDRRRGRDRDSDARYPGSGGYLQVSAVGFDAAKIRAMVYMGHHCGGLCGGGAFHLMTKVNGQWREADVDGVSNCTWVS